MALAPPPDEQRGDGQHHRPDAEEERADLPTAGKTPPESVVAISVTVTVGVGLGGAGTVTVARGAGTLTVTVAAGR